MEITSALLAAVFAAERPAHRRDIFPPLFFYPEAAQYRDGRRAGTTPS